VAVPPTHIKINEMSGVTVVRPEGKLTGNWLRDPIARVATEKSQIVVDLTEVRSIDSNGIGDLVGALDAVTKGGGSLVLACPSPRLVVILTTCKLDELITWYESVPLAIAAIKGKHTEI
jgi:anti-anti-sigma factor